MRNRSLQVGLLVAENSTPGRPLSPRTEPSLQPPSDMTVQLLPVATPLLQGAAVAVLIAALVLQGAAAQGYVAVEDISCTGAAQQGELSCRSCTGCYSNKAASYTVHLQQETYDETNDITTIGFVVRRHAHTRHRGMPACSTLTQSHLSPERHNFIISLP